MKQVFITIGVLLLVAFGIRAYAPNTQPLGAGGGNGGDSFYYTSAVHSTSTVNPYTWTLVSATSSAAGNKMLCNNADSGVDANNPIYLLFGTASTTANVPRKPFGDRLASGDCFEMTGLNMPYTPVYAIASTATTTLLQKTANH